MSKLIIGADLAPTYRNENYFAEDRLEEIVSSEVRELLSSADYRIFDMEVPLTDEAHPIPKSGPHLMASTDCIKVYKSLGVDFVTLANNHVLDQGVQGLQSTIDTVRQAGIAYAGVGGAQEAAKPYIFKLDGRRIGVYCGADNELSIATEHMPGANLFDPMESPDHIRQLRQQCDFLICLHHGGREEYSYPPPYLRKVCRKMVDCGADLVLCQHNQCIGCEERYGTGVILYGQGNFIFDYGDNECQKTALLAQVELREDGWELSYQPVERWNHGVCIPSQERQDEIMAGFWARTEAIKEPGTLEALFTDYCQAHMGATYSNFNRFAFQPFMQVLNVLSGRRLRAWYLRRVYGRRALAMVNALRCESHRETFVWELTHFN